MSPYSMSHVHLGRFLLARLEQHCARRTDTHELDVFCAQGALICRSMGPLLPKGPYLLDQHVTRVYNEIGYYCGSPRDPHHSCNRLNEFLLYSTIFIHRFDQTRGLPLRMMRKLNFRKPEAEYTKSGRFSFSTKMFPITYIDGPSRLSENGNAKAIYGLLTGRQWEV